MAEHFVNFTVSSPLKGSLSPRNPLRNPLVGPILSLVRPKMSGVPNGNGPRDVDSMDDLQQMEGMKQLS